MTGFIIIQFGMMRLQTDSITLSGRHQDAVINIKL